MLKEFINKHRLCEAFSHTAKQHYLPLAEKLAPHQRSARSPLFVGINGCQGSGKSTLSAFIQDYLSQQFSLKVVVLSLDDFYLSQIQRKNLAIDVHPLLSTRGVPGTHNMGQAKQVLIALKNRQSVIIPRFNKATDNPHHPEQWTQISEPVDLVIFEGWCWGVAPQDTNQLIEPVNALEADEDPKGLWRSYVNTQLAKHYQGLYSMFDQWVMLKAPSFADVYAWRLEQEQKLLSASSALGKQSIMNAAQIERFIQHYQRLTEHGLATFSQQCDYLFELNSAREIISATERA
ncbi:kinase [Paraglaciecola aestuariivivens]